MQRLLRPLLSLFLLVLPLLAVNAGWWFLSERRIEWELLQQEEAARQELESLARGWSFESQFGRLGGDFRTILRRAVNLAAVDPVARGLNGGGLPEIKDRATRLFTSPFPAHELWLFRLPPVEAASSVLPLPDPLLTPEQSRNSRRTMAMVMEHLVARTTDRPRAGETDRRLDKVIRTLFGQGMSPQDLARTQRGLPTPILHQRQRYWLYWDFLQDPGREGVGFVLLVPSGVRERLAGFRLALDAYPPSRGAMSGFLRILPNPVGDLLPPKLRRSRLFHQWRDTIGGLKRFSKHESDGFPWRQQIGAHRLFTMIIPECTHLAFILMPLLPAPSLPPSLLILNLLFAGGAFLIFTRGWLLGHWPILPLAWRFAGMFLLAVALPLSILVIAASAYLQERERQGHHQLQTQLLNTLQGFEAGKDRLQGEYIAGFRRLLQSQELRRMLAKDGIGAPGLIELFRSHFQNRSGNLPLAYFAIIDQKGRQIASSDVDINPDEISGALRLVRAGLIGSLRERIKRQGGGHLLGPDPLTEADRIFIDAYNGATGNSIQSEVNMGRGEPFIYNIGRGGASQLFDHLQIDGLDRFIVFLTWRDADLDERILRQCWNDAGIKNPRATFTAWRFGNERLEPLLPQDRHQSTPFHHALQAAAVAAARRQGLVAESRGAFSIIALPARRFRSIVFSAGAPHEAILSDIQRRKLEFFGYLLISLIGALWLGRLTAQRFVRPVVELKVALDQVSAGNLDLELLWQRPDEFGNLASSFTTMIGGLRERRQLATLVSSAALDAISGSDQAEQGLASRTFPGVILVSDIRGFTPLCETHPPDEITHLLNRHFTEMTTIVTGEGGRVDKFIGDALQAVFEERPDLPPAAIRAIHAALGMLCSLERINHHRQEEGAFRYSVGVGLAGGMLLGGAIGDRGTRLDFALLGPPLRRATRLESMGRENTLCPIIVGRELIPNCGPYRDFLSPLPQHPDEAFTFGKHPEQILSETAELLPAAKEVEEQPVPAASAKVESAPTGSGPQMQETLREEHSVSRIGWSFLPACIWLLLPLFVLFLSHQQSLDFLRHLAESEFHVKHREALQRIKHPSFHTTQLEDILETLGRNVIVPSLAGISASSPASLHPEIASAATVLINRLTELGHPPYRVSILAGPPVPITQPVASETFDLVFTHGIEPSEHLWFRQLQTSGLRFFGVDFSLASADLEQGMGHIIGLDKPIRFLNWDGLGNLLAAEWHGKPVWFYSQTLLSPDPAAPPIPSATEARVLVQHPSPPQRRIGSLLLLLSRNVDKSNSLPKLVSEFRDPPTRAALVPTDGSSHLASISEGRLQTREPLENGGPWDLVLTSPLPQRTNSSPLENPLMLNFLLGASVIAIFFLYQTIRGKALARFLAWQLQAGLVLASLFPLAAVWGLLERFSVEERAGLLHQERIQLNHSLDEFERRHLLQRGMCEWFFERWGRDPRFLPILDRSVASSNASATTINRIDRQLQRFFEMVSRRSNTVEPHQYLRELVTVDSQGWYRDLKANNTVKNSEETFAKTVGMIGRIILQDIGDSSNPSLATDNLGQSFVGEMGTNIGLEILRTVFGPDVYFQILHRPGEVVRLYGGLGLVQLCLKLLPKESPRFLLAWFFGGTQLEESAAARIQRSNQSRFAMYGFHRQLSGILQQPRFCGQFTDLERIARQVKNSRAPVSSRSEVDGNQFLVEGRIGVLNTLVCFVGVAAEAPILQSSIDRQRFLLGLLFIGFVATLLLAITVSRQLLDPIHQLRQGMREIEAGRYQSRLPLEQRDELGDLVQAFNTMARGLEERELMGRMVSRDARRTSLAASAMASMTLASERRDAVVMITGVPQFEQRIANLTPNQVFQHLSFQLSTLYECITAEGGDIDKVIGEKVLVVFPGGQEGARAAFAVLERFGKAEATSGLPLGIAAGVSSGPVVAGFLGAGERRDHTVIGDTVNTAARVEGVAEKLHRNRFLLTQSVVEMLPPGKPVHPFETVTVKGKKDAISLFQIGLPPT